MNISPHDRTELRPAAETPTVQLSTAQVDALTPGAVLGGRYRIVSLVGRGGMGEVYRADDLRLHIPVALKFLTAQTTLDERALHDEVRVGRQISHPNVCRLFDIEELDGRIFISMEYIDGEDLASLLHRAGRLSPDRAMAVARDLCAGVAAAHELRVIHRDLKPGNVLIDGRGRARITDFGLAVEHDHAQASAGTPGYMAPEQLAGHRATIQSDLYALGLVLYELFTGVRAIEGRTLGEIVEQQREQRFLRPSAIVPDIQPAVEQAILRCLDPDPEARPASVHEIVRELPSFDPIAAALAAGETPSAGMVAASASKGDLSASVAWTLLGTAIAGLFVAAAVAPRAMVVSGSSAKPPEVLLERVREVLAAAGATEKPADSGFNYERDDEHIELHRGRSTLRTPVEFVYRESPAPMQPRRGDRRLTVNDPPFDRQGMKLVRLDGTGRLIELAIIPPKLDEKPPHPGFDWSKLHAFARVDPKILTPARSVWSARGDTDGKHAWTLEQPALRIEAATYHGRPVWFWLSEPMQSAVGASANRNDRRLAAFVEMVLLIVLPTTVFIVALRNYRRGNSDRRGAVRLTVFFTVVVFIAAMLRMHHPATFRAEWQQVSHVVAETVFWSLVLGVAYVAIEPLVRRRWPHMLISWGRLLAGRWRDPMVGRDILIGSVAGVGLALAQRMTAIAPRWWGLDTDPLLDAATVLGSTRHAGVYLLLALLQSIYKSIFAVVLLLLLRALLRRTSAAVLLSAGLCAAFYFASASGPIAVRIGYALLIGIAIYAVMLRFGLLALVATGYAASVLFEIPLTLDTTAWWFPRAALVVLVLAALAAYGFYVSLAGKRWLPRLAM